MAFEELYNRSVNTLHLQPVGELREEHLPAKHTACAEPQSKWKNAWAFQCYPVLPPFYLLYQNPVQKRGLEMGVACKFHTVRLRTGRMTRDF